MSHRMTKSLQLHSNETFVVVPSVNIPIIVVSFYKGVKLILRVASLLLCNVCITIGNCLKNINNKGFCIMYLQVNYLLQTQGMVRNDWNGVCPHLSLIPLNVLCSSSTRTTPLPTFGWFINASIEHTNYMFQNLHNLVPHHSIPLGGYDCKQSKLDP